MIPAEVILLFEEAVVNVANKEGRGSLAEEILKVMSDRVKRLLLGPVYGDGVQSAQGDLQHLEVSAGVISHVLNFQPLSHKDCDAFATSLAQEIAGVAL